MSFPTYEQIDYSYRDPEAVKKVFAEAYANGLEATSEGRVATYIPELSKADPSAFGLFGWKKDGETLSFGDTTTRFTIQSISKVINLAVALKYIGFRDVFSHVLMEPSGDEFNSIIKLDTVNSLPFNPLINAGAIEIVSLLEPLFSFEELLDLARSFCMDNEITLNEAVYRSEAETGDRNRAIAYLLKSKGVMKGDPDRITDLYFRMCSLNVSARSLAGLGLVLACDGSNPFTGKHLVSPGYIRVIKSIMFTCGLYNESGSFGVKVGLPAKSGVGGGITCAVKGPMGIGLYGPALDGKGNSVAGIRALEHLSHRLRLHVFAYE